MRLIILTVALLQSLFTITSAVITTRGELNNEKAITEFIAMDHQFLLQGLPQACVLDPIANEHICQAWKDAIFANNLQSNMSAVWRAERPAIFPSEEELAADRAWLQAERMRELKAETYAIDDSSLEKRKRKSKTTMTTQEETTTSKYHLPKPTWPLHKDPQKLEHCPCCDNERRIICCLGSPFFLDVSCCVKMNKICHKEISVKHKEIKCDCEGWDDCTKKGFWKHRYKPYCG